jgi:uncharacterized protein involved in oxidation of intracellular sulfur
MKTRHALVCLLATALVGTIPAFAGVTECNTPRGGTKPQKLGIVLTTNDPETVFNVFRLANFSADSGDTVSIFLLGKGVELDRIKSAKFDIPAQVHRFLSNGQKIMACATCLKFHQSSGSEMCPISTMQDLYDLIRASDRVLTF